MELGYSEINLIEFRKRGVRLSPVKPFSANSNLLNKISSKYEINPVFIKINEKTIITINKYTDFLNLNSAKIKTKTE
jgi:hypothetical protein